MIEKTTTEIKTAVLNYLNRILNRHETRAKGDFDDAEEIMVAFDNIEAQVPRWVRVGTVLPEFGVLCLVQTAHHGIRVASRVAIDKAGTWFWHASLSVFRHPETHAVDVTHWMPLPEPPPVETPTDWEAVFSEIDAMELKGPPSASIGTLTAEELAKPPPKEPHE